MQVKALKSFQGRHGYIRAGQTVNLEDGYARDLAKNKLVELPGGEQGEGIRPTNRQAVARAPAVGGGARPGRQPALGDGPTLTPLSSRAAQARGKKTQTVSVRGAKTTTTRVGSKNLEPGDKDRGGAS